MPLYSYTTAKGVTVERHFSMGKAPESVSVGGERAERDMVADFTGRQEINNTWPMRSDAMGVNPEHADEAMAQANSIGVPTQFDKCTGEAIFTNARHRKRYCEAHGYFDRNGGYNDPAPKHQTSFSRRR